MALPRLGQYQTALQHPETAFRDPDLKAARIETTPLGLPRVISGGFALTYHLQNGRKEWAVRCFHREASELQRRYAAIAAALGARAHGPFVPVAYVADGVHVEGGWYPITKMPWLQAVPLNRYLDANLSTRTAARLAEQFRALLGALHALGAAHGDLQHGNILVDGARNLKLVDYDGMYVPALHGMAANESGHVNYQHPQRDGQFAPDLDRFSALVIYTALTALAVDTALWGRHANGENLLFKRADFADPAASPLFAELRALPSIKPLADRLAIVCRSDYAAVPDLDGFLTGRVAVARAGSRQAAAGAGPLLAAGSRFPAAGSQLLRATDVAGLIEREGDVVTVVGQVSGARQGWSRVGRAYVFVNFGDERNGCFALVLWSLALNVFAQSGQNLNDYAGRWVRVTGLVSVYRTRVGRNGERPQMVINEPSEIQVIAEEQARELLGEGPPAWVKTHRRPRRAQPIILHASTAAALNRLYAAPATAAGSGGTVAATSSKPARRPRRPRTQSTPARGAGKKRAPRTAATKPLGAPAATGVPVAADAVAARWSVAEFLRRISAALSAPLW